MKVAKDEVYVQMDSPEAKLRQRMNFDDANGYGKINGGISV